MRLALPALCLLLAACEPSLNVDLAVTPPADASSVRLRLDGVELRKTDGGTQTRARNEIAEFLVQRDVPASPRELIGNSKVDGGEYAGLRLRFADDPGSVARTGQAVEFIETVSVGEAAVAFSVDEDEDDRVSLLVFLDLPLSLRENEDEAGFTLDPLLRAMEAADAASLRGSVPLSRLNDPACAADSQGTSGALVYAFAGQDVTPDERDAAGVEPYAVAPILRSGTTTAGIYRLDGLAPGDYTLALTCEGEFENGLASSGDEDIDFFEGGEVSLEPGEDGSFDFSP